MKLDIEIDSRNNGKFFHKNKGISGASKCKLLALRDITKECGINKFYTQNYLNKESAVLENCKKILIVLPIDTTKY